MRRLTLLLLAAAAAMPLLAGSPAHASTICTPHPPLPGRQPFCTVYCAMTLDLSDPCWSED